MKTCYFLHSAQEYDSEFTHAFLRCAHHHDLQAYLVLCFLWVCYKFSFSDLRWKPYLRSSYYFIPCHPEHTQTGNAAAHKDEIVKESLAVSTRLICLVGFFIGLLSPVRALFLGIKYPNRNTCSLYHTCSQEARVVYLSELWIASLIIFWFEALRRKTVTDTTCLICTCTLVMRANRTLLHLQNAVLLAGIRSRLFMHYRSSSGSAWRLFLTRNTHC